MEDKICLIHQPAGIGDVFFCQGISDNFIEQGFKVLWPIVPEYKWALDHMEKDGVQFCTTDEDFDLMGVFGDHRPLMTEDKSMIYVPLSFADSYVQGMGVMDAKFAFCNVEIGDWRENITLNRNRDREESLLKHLNIGDDFIFVNRNYGTPPNTAIREGIEPEGEVVEMKFIEGYNIFDWLGVMEKAKEIHTIGTSICYLIDYFEEDIKPERMVIYNRPEDSGFEHLKNVHLRDEWEFVKL